MEVIAVPLQLDSFGPLLPLAAMVIGLIIIGLVSLGLPDDAIVGGSGLFLSGLTGYFLTPLSGPIGMAAGFLVYTFVFYLIWKRYVRTSDSTPTLSTSNASDLSGERATVTSRISAGGKGEVRLRDSGKTFFARSETGSDIEQGEDVLVLDPNGGTILSVAPEDYSFTDESDLQTDTE